MVPLTRDLGKWFVPGWHRYTCIYIDVCLSGSAHTILGEALAEH